MDLNGKGDEVDWKVLLSPNIPTYAKLEHTWYPSAYVPLLNIVHVLSINVTTTLM
mgnify:CR=1 FL=1